MSKIFKKIRAYANLRHLKYEFCKSIYIKATPEDRKIYQKEMDFALEHPEIKLGDPLIQLPN
jgi:hypothetical protein